MMTFTRNYVTLMVICALVLCIPSQGCPQQMTFGQSWLNQTLEGEKLPNILATDFSFQLESPDAGATYRARLHNDDLIWQRLEVGPRYGNIQAFYSLDLINEMCLSGGGLCFKPLYGNGRSVELKSGLYDRGYCFEGVCAVELSGISGRLGYEYRKLGDLRWWGPSVSLGVTW